MKYKKGDRVIIDAAPLIASHVSSGTEHAGEILHVTADGERVYFAPDKGSPMYIHALWIKRLEKSE